MKKSLNDEVVDEINDRYNLFIDKVRERSKGNKPFRAEPVDDNLMYYYYVQNFERAPDKFQRMNYLIQRHGAEKVNDFLYKMHQIGTDRRRKLGGSNA